MYTPEQAYELAILALCVWREARGEPDEGKHAVAWTIRNRVHGKAWFGGSWVGVILKPYQFSSFNHTDPNSTSIPNPATDPSFGACLLAAKHVYDETYPDPVAGAQYYYKSSIAKPAWAEAMAFVAMIGKQSFYREG